MRAWYHLLAHALSIMLQHKIDNFELTKCLDIQGIVSLKISISSFTNFSEPRWHPSVRLPLITNSASWEKHGMGPIYIPYVCLGNTKILHLSMRFSLLCKFEDYVHKTVCGKYIIFPKIWKVKCTRAQLISGSRVPVAKSLGMRLTHHQTFLNDREGFVV